MAEKIKRCIIFSGSPDADPKGISDLISPGDYIICADSGYSLALRAGVRPHLFVGDCDSCREAPGGDTERVILNTHKDDTDTHHCAKLAVERGFDKVVIFGATGGRLDHTYANLSVLKYLFDNSVDAELVNGRETVRYIRDCSLVLNGMSGATFSVFPFGCGSVTLSIDGEAEYPAENLVVRCDDTVGISNIVRSDKIEIAVKGGALVITEKDV